MKKLLILMALVVIPLLTSSVGKEVFFGVTVSESRIETQMSNQRCGWPIGMATIPAGTELKVIQTQSTDPMFGQWSLAAFKKNGREMIAWVKGPIHYDSGTEPVAQSACPMPPQVVEG